MTQVKRQIHLAAHFPGVNSTTVWSDPQAGSHIDFASFVHLAQTAERAKFDFFFLAEGLRMREHASRLHELDVAGGPDDITVLAALASVTDRIGLVPAITTAYHEPHELARRPATLDHLSAGRAAAPGARRFQRRLLQRHAAPPPRTRTGVQRRRVTAGTAPGERRPTTRNRRARLRPCIPGIGRAHDRAADPSGNRERAMSRGWLEVMGATRGYH